LIKDEKLDGYVQLGEEKLDGTRRRSSHVPLDEEKLGNGRCTFSPTGRSLAGGIGRQGTRRESLHVLLDEGKRGSGHCMLSWMRSFMGGGCTLRDEKEVVVR